MKRAFICLLLAVLGTGSIFAQVTQDGKGHTQAREFSLSAGGRIFYNGMFDIWEYSNSYYPAIASILENSLHDNHGFGIGAFFDATYVEVSLDFIFGSFKPNSKGYADDFKVNSTQFGFTILGKFPFAVGPLAIFPLAGIDYQIFLSGENDGYTIERNDMSGDFKDIYNAFSLVAGAGLDYNITQKLYLRGEVLVNFKMESESDKALKKLAKASNIDFSLFTMGTRVSIGVGYKFGNFGKNN